LEVGDGLAELLALLDIGEGVVEGALGDAEGLGADGDPAVVQGPEGQGEALVLGAEAVGGRDPDVGADDLGGG
jgi:hypothetical protein